MATTIPEAVTTIPAGTLRLLLVLIGYRAKARKEMRRKPPMVPRRPPRPAAGLTRRVEGARLTRCRIASRRTWETSRPRRADPVQVETLTPQQVRRVCTADSVSALSSDPQTVGADPAGLAWYAIRCTVWHGSITGGAPLYTFYNRRLCWPVQRPAWRWYLGMCWMASGRCDTLQRGTGGIIAACVSLVSAAAERYKLLEKRL